LLAQYFSGDKIEKSEMSGACRAFRERGSAYKDLVGKPEGKRPLGRHRHRWEDNIKMDIPGLGGEGMEWIELAQDTDKWQALANAVMNLRVP
jgi:hypothetical protein